MPLTVLTVLTAVSDFGVGSTTGLPTLRSPATSKERGHMTRRQYLLRTDTIQDVLDRQHLTHQRFSEHLGLSRSYWSQVFNRRRPLSPDVRRDLLASRYLRSLAEEQLWDVIEAASL